MNLDLNLLSSFRNMGIKGFKQFLRAKFPTVLQPYHISHLESKRVAVDLLPYLYKYKASMGDNWADGILLFLFSFLRNTIHVTLVMDGPFVTVAKKDEQEKRRSNRSRMVEKVKELTEDLAVHNETGVISDRLKELPIEASTQKNLLLGLPEEAIDSGMVQAYIEKLNKQIVNIRPEDIEEIKEMCSVLHITFYTAEQEAESLCSYLCKTGQVDAVVTEDSDVVAYGCPVWISSIDFNGDCTILVQKDLLEQMGWNDKQLVDFCIMCGTDYNHSIPKIGPVSAYQLIHEHKSIEEVCKEKKIGGEELKVELNRSLFCFPCKGAVVSKTNHRKVEVKVEYQSIPDQKEVNKYLRQKKYPVKWAMEYFIQQQSKIIIEE